MNLELTGKNAIITGGSGPIARATAEVLAQEGVGVALASRTRETLEAAAREVAAKTRGRVIGIPTDVTDNASVEQMVQQALSQLGSVDILVNCAVPRVRSGVEGGATFPAEEQFHAELDVKVMGYLRCAKAVAPLMQARGWGRIVNLSGLNARNSIATLGAIRNVSVVAMTKNLADQLGPDGINVTVVHPGAVKTERTLERAERMGMTLEQFEASVAGANAIGRMVTAEEVAWVIAFLCSPRSVAISGDVVTVGGGAGKAIYY